MRALSPRKEGDLPKIIQQVNVRAKLDPRVPKPWFPLLAKVDVAFWIDHDITREQASPSLKTAPSPLLSCSIAHRICSSQVSSSSSVFFPATSPTWLAFPWKIYLCIFSLQDSTQLFDFQGTIPDFSSSQ